MIDPARTPQGAAHSGLSPTLAGAPAVKAGMADRVEADGLDGAIRRLSARNPSTRRVAAENHLKLAQARAGLGPAGWPSIAAVPAIVVHCVKLALSDFWINREAPELTDDQLRPIIGRYMAVSIG